MHLHEEDRISLDEYVSKYPNAVYCIQVDEDCLEYSGIESQDLLVVDKSLKPVNGDIVIGVLNSQHILACYLEFQGQKYLMPDNPKYDPHIINELDEFIIEGVIPHSILDQRKQNSVCVDYITRTNIC